jgi:hypothetical protein
MLLSARQPAAACGWLPRGPHQRQGEPMAQRASPKEEEYFLLQEAERLRHLAAAREKQLQVAEREQRKTLLWMKCPKDGMDLVEVELSGIKVDKCFTCEGVFLDAGELEVVVKQESGFLGRLNRIFGKRA